MIKLDIFSDPICPWCYIGWTALARAIAEAPDNPFVVEWHPFQLNPTMPREGMDRTEYLEHKFGGREGAVTAYAPIVERAEAEKLDMNLGGIARTPNTLDAHRLIHWAGLENRQTQVVDALFAAYFTENRDIGDPDTLADVADGAGLDAAMVRRLLQGDQDVEDIRARDAHGRERGLTGVPTFIIANTHVVPGAQPTDLWLKLIAEINEQIA
ncbi:polyketide biosynthesis protein [Pacificitalea manganoxidans]|uniref:Polyketide biosynthesis protein n=1 Tax=Pacificitalea manganoxidans TaxID=1411902 RepID=A0A291LZR1_9RHOB|nr:DsbA family oxidoreductase [Pacificitalea manganoxidans]ATI42201.1 polyketide biosynthesis protein [Pacificitalea manganoxidans]MBF53351.1 DsbA family oxidoreductase [Actibacterium sp.]MDR6307986.1 putative DsbA family dithiol-disulfide isomerase [Pacificitalea manganoxidans]OWU72065.1 polyketide biosynthesis protein [Roseovarius sp. 22II1-1F6A]|tara:strand:+ start:144 stop:779 length:636 start_codon:yes stop_codon:yes gene_type:complete